jgi:hypothetical protein
LSNGPLWPGIDIKFKERKKEKTVAKEYDNVGLKMWESLQEHIGKLMGTDLAHIGNKRKIPLPPPLKTQKKKN